MIASKTLKNLIVITLLFAILFMISVPYASAFASDTFEFSSEAQKAYDFLKAVGAMDTEEAEFEETRMITRAHFVKLALHLSNFDSQIFTSDDEVFEDVTSETMYENYIETAYRLGYISGSAQKLFEPEQVITLAQALKIICGILGYQQYAEMTGGFPGGYLVISQRLRLLDGISIADNQGLDMSNAMILLRNASETKLLQITGISDGLEMETIGDETILSENHKIKSEEGIITANGYTDLLARESELSRNQVKINDIIFYSALSNVQDYIGYNVRLYYKDDNKTIKDVVYVELSEENNIISLSSEDLTVERNQVSCFAEDGSSSVIRLSEDVTYILNGKMAIMSSADLQNIDKCSIKFISNDGDRIVDVVNIKKYDTVIVNGISSSSGIVIANDGSKLNFDQESDKYTFSFVKNGDSVTFDSLSQNDVLLVCEGRGPGLCHIEVIASNKTTTGLFNELGDGYVVIGENRYELDTALIGKVDIGKSYTAYFDAFGNIAHISANRNLVYGYLYGLNKQQMNNPICRIFTEYDRWVDLYFAKRIKYNGETIDAEELYNNLTGEDTYRQLIKYKVNDNREIIVIETAKEYLIGNEDEDYAIENDIFRISFKGTGQYRSTNRSIDGKVVVDPNAKVFFVPSDFNEDDFKVKSGSELVDDAGYTLTAYDVDEHLMAKVIVTNDTATEPENNSSNKFMVVKSIGMILNSEGEAVPSIRGYWNTTEISVPVLVGDKGVSIDEINSLETGDVIIVKYDDDSNIKKLVSYSLEDEVFASTLPSYGAYSGVIACGRVDKIDYAGKKLRISSVTEDSGEYRSISYADSTTCAIWESETQRYTPVASSELLPGDIVFVNMRYFQCIDILAVRN